MIAKNLTELSEKLQESPTLKESIQKDPIAFLGKVKMRHPIWSKAVFLTVVGFVSLALLRSLIIAAMIIPNPDVE